MKYYLKLSSRRIKCSCPKECTCTRSGNLSGFSAIRAGDPHLSRNWFFWTLITPLEYTSDPSFTWTAPNQIKPARLGYSGTRTQAPFLCWTLSPDWTSGRLSFPSSWGWKTWFLLPEAPWFFFWYLPWWFRFWWRLLFPVGCSSWHCKSPWNGQTWCSFQWVSVRKPKTRSLGMSAQSSHAVMRW